ncbi:methyl-accepting chemotaxis protein [Vibrio albus]|uniref:Methyl-accepting chemotaxis protein n=1 Tax=Vibrio albus TaxID=2200953 RepID=A0A2U3B6K0_9VIBR|nr:methyl-accepting chemotaxis protein [Vibrio albus]PWI32345.1 methyl-accepting chemotaxis protein [Vibrio albus]
MIRYYKNQSVGFQLGSVMAICLLISFCSIAALVYRNADQVLLDATLKEQQSKVDALAKTIAGQFDAYLELTKILEATFQHGYLKGIRIEEDVVHYRGYQVRNISLNGESLVGNNTTVDTFTQDTNAIATVFSPAGNEWVRVSTSLENSQGQRVLGTTLGNTHPGYRKLMSGEPYYAQVDLFGERYITYYSPIKNDRNKVVAITFIGFPVDDITRDIFKSLQSVPWGDTGYTFIVENDKDHLGHYLLHPKWNKDDPSIINVSDHSGNKPFHVLFENSSGVFLYPWEYKGTVGQKYVVYADVPGWNWKLLGGTFIDEVTKESNELLKLIAMISLLVGTVTFIIMTFIVLRTTKPLTRLTGYMDRLGRGEISLSIETGAPQSGNEITKLNNSVAGMAKKLSQLVNNIRSNSDQVNRQSANVLNDATLNLSHSDEQLEKVEHIVTAIEEMASSAQSVAQQVETIAENVRHADSDTQNGLSMIENIGTDVTRLNDQLDQSAKAIEQVKTDSMDIHTVTKMIDDIAEQTNLLALNAAIEAARAGEHGRGFSVVADEVRTLAHRTQLSVKDVVSIIDNLKASTDNAVSLMHNSQQQALSVLDKAREGGTTLESIAHQVRDISSQTEAIAATSEEQAQVSHEVAASTSDISTLNNQSRSTSAQTSQSADTLSQLAQDLKQQVDFFH